MDTSGSINAGNAISVAHINLLARAFNLLPTIALSTKDLIILVDNPDGAVITYRRPVSSSRERDPSALVPLKNLLSWIYSNKFVSASSGDLTKSPRHQMPYIIKAILNKDVIFFISSYHCLIIGNINCCKQPVGEKIPTGNSCYLLRFIMLAKWSTV